MTGTFPAVQAMGSVDRRGELLATFKTRAFGGHFALRRFGLLDRHDLDQLTFVARRDD
jgi:hypothetical protein